MQVTQGPTGTRDPPRIPAAFGLTAPEIEGLLVTAGRAPSLHNSQPWQFRVTPRAIELHADPRRSLVVADPDDRELRIACGAALFNLQLALHGHGIRPIVTILPDRARPGLLAVVRHGGTKDPTPEQQDLLRAVASRRTNRHPFTDAPVDTPSLQALRRAALDEGAWLHVVLDPEQRSALRTIAARAHREQAADPAFRAELAAWTTATPGRRDGVPASAAGARPEPQDAWVLRDFTGGHGSGTGTRQGLRNRARDRRVELAPQRTVRGDSGRTGIAAGAADRDGGRTRHIVPLARGRGARHPGGAAQADRWHPPAAGGTAHRARMARAHTPTPPCRGPPHGRRGT